MLYLDDFFYVWQPGGTCKVVSLFGFFPEKLTFHFTSHFLLVESHMAPATTSNILRMINPTKVDITHTISLNLHDCAH